nr:retrovirus-related Pol polyprotein from transposon TNT 1-94 [Tanacetum cinerariifolium]
MTIETHNWSSSAHQELHKIIRDENFPIVNHVDARLQNFEIQFLKEAAKFVGDFKSLANEADASLAKHKALELEMERLLKPVVSQDIMIIMKNESVVDTSDLQTELKLSTPQESKGVNNDKVIAPGMFRINPSKTSREEKHVPNTVSASARTKPITVSQPHVISNNDVNSDLNGLSSTGVDNTKTRKPQPRSDTKHDRVPFASKSSQGKNKEAEVEEHHRNLLFSKNNKHISSACNNIKIDSQDVISKVVYATCKKCLIFVNHDKYLHTYVNGKNSHGKKQKAKVSFKENQMKYRPKVTKPKKVEHHKSLATPKPRKSRLLLRVYFIEGLGHNLFSVGQFCDSDLDVAFRRDACFVRNLEGVNLLKGDHSTNLYTINLNEMAFASPIFLMARASSTKSWLWHQRLSHLNFDTINDLARNDLVA